MIAQWLRPSNTLAEDPGLDPIVHVGLFTATCGSSLKLGSDQTCVTSADTYTLMHIPTQTHTI